MKTVILLVFSLLLGCERAKEPPKTPETPPAKQGTPVKEATVELDEFEDAIVEIHQAELVDLKIKVTRMENEFERLQAKHLLEVVNKQSAQIANLIKSLDQLRNDVSTLKTTQVGANQSLSGIRAEVIEVMRQAQQATDEVNRLKVRVGTRPIIRR